MGARPDPAAAVAYQPSTPWRRPPAAAHPLPAPRPVDEVRARAQAFGPASLTTAEALELFLRRAARGRAAEAAERLLQRFGSLPEVLGAPLAELRQTASPAIAAEIQLLHDLHGRSLREAFHRRPLMSSWSQVCAYLRTAMAALPREQFRVLFLDRRSQLIADELLGEGTIDHAPVYPREVVRRALEVGASALVLAHNHPSRDPAPSAADVEMTRKVVEAARALGLAVHDHVVVAGTEVASLRALGLM